MRAIFIYFIGFILSFLLGIQESMVAVGSLITIDTIFGLLASEKAGRKVTSRKFARVLTKMLVYNLLIISAHVSEQYLVPQIPFVSLTLSFLAISEFFSISESFTVITGMNFTRFLKDKVQHFLSNKTKDENERD